MNPTAHRWLVLAASSASAARAYAYSMGIRPTILLTGTELVTNWSRLCTMMRAGRIDGILLHTTAWRREVYPQVFQAALALAPVHWRYLADEETQSIRQITRCEAIRWIAGLPFHAMASLGLVGTGVAQLALSRHPPPVERNLRLRADGNAVLAIWRGPTGNSTGGAITHLSGILGAFGRIGFRVGLVTVVPPPPQLQAVIDDVEVVSPPGAAARVSHDVNEITADRPIKQAGLRLAQRLHPDLVYQRHATFLTAGMAIARVHDVPLVLEWNCSEVWARTNWQRRLPPERAFKPLARHLERRMAVCADIVAAVSDPAAEMARQAGAREDRIVVVPNGVDVEKVRPNSSAADNTAGHDRLLGWVGTFGPWHGAEVLVEALALLPTDVHLLMIGDGVGRAVCASLARKLGVANRITWSGTLAHEVALARLAACDVLVSPHVPLPDTPFFGSPTKLFEYMALGRPIVASRLEQLGEVLEDGRTARLVLPGDPVELSKGILDVLGRPDRGERLGLRARQEAVEHHTWDHRVASILERLELDGPGRRDGAAAIREEPSHVRDRWYLRVWAAHRRGV
jgi:glycosyltransferase involved in cell wall biosynthesis